ncbi:MAG: radical SAM protein [Blautia sp.]|nr:radical SAM protein [Blautia sp.]
MDRCMICPRNCGADRDNQKTGYCGMPSEIRASRAALHMWEEPCISGTKGSGTVFFAGCSLRCCFCQNQEIALGNHGKVVTIERLADIFLELEQQGAANINLVTATHYVPQVVKALEIAKSKGMLLPVVYNCGGYEKVETLRLLDGLVDIFLPDCKYLEKETASNYSNAADYPEVVKAALNEMFRQVGVFQVDRWGYCRKGMIVRHLVLPGHTRNAIKVLEYLHEAFGDSIAVSIMNQYTPVRENIRFPELNRKVTRREYEKVLKRAYDLDFAYGYYQEGETAKESFIPPFGYQGL